MTFQKLHEQLRITPKARGPRLVTPEVGVDLRLGIGPQDPIISFFWLMAILLHVETSRFIDSRSNVISLIASRSSRTPNVRSPISEAW